MRGPAAARGIGAGGPRRARAGRPRARSPRPADPTSRPRPRLRPAAPPQQRDADHADHQRRRQQRAEDRQHPRLSPTAPPSRPAGRRGTRCRPRRRHHEAWRPARRMAVMVASAAWSPSARCCACSDSRSASRRDSSASIVTISCSDVACASSARTRSSACLRRPLSIREPASSSEDVVRVAPRRRHPQQRLVELRLRHPVQPVGGTASAIVEGLPACPAPPAADRRRPRGLRADDAAEAVAICRTTAALASTLDLHLHGAVRTRFAAACETPAATSRAAGTTRCRPRVSPRSAAAPGAAATGRTVRAAARVLLRRRDGAGPRVGVGRGDGSGPARATAAGSEESCAHAPGRTA